MTTNYIQITSGLGVKQAMHALVSQAAENDNISTIYVIDEDGTFYGAIDLKDLIIAREGSNLDDIIMTSYPYVYAQETIDDCIERMKDYSEDSIPVLGNDNKLLGVITAQNMVEVIDAEMGEDYAKLAGLTAEEDLREPVKESIKKRMPWLLILLCLGMVVSSVVGLFENVVSQLPIVMAFQSLILDMAGNVGTQSLAVTIRVLMDENLSGKQKLGLVWKEMRVGFMNGVILGLLAFAVIGGYIYLLKGRTLGFAYAVSACIGAALLLAMLISSIAGTVIPMFFKKINVDPAVASGPLITTLNDLVAVISYYGLAWIFLLQVLHLAD
jgi:magnesium transporter